MVIVIEGSILETLDESIFKTFMPKDTVILLSFKGQTLPVSVVKKLSEIRAKIEIREIPHTDNKEDNKLILAYSIGRIIEKEHTIKLYSETFESVMNNDDVSKDLGLPAVKTKKKAVSKPAIKVKGKRGRKPKAVTDKPQKTVKNKEEKPKKAVKTVKTKKAPSKADKGAEKAKKADIMDIFKSAPDNIKELAEKNKANIIKAVKEATDPNIGLKTKLELYIREEGWEEIWKIVSPEFDKLR